MPEYNVPGVYIEEQTGPGVITGVGTSTAAFVGPALRGPINEAMRVTSFDEFLANYAEDKSDGRKWPYITEPRPFYLAHAVRGFFQNGGRQAYVVRVGTGLRSKLSIKNQGGEDVFVVEAQQEGSMDDKIKAETQLSAMQEIAVGSSKVISIEATDATKVIVEDASCFQVGDVVTKDNQDFAKIAAKDGNTVKLDVALPNLAKDSILAIANISPTQKSFRLGDAHGFYPGVTALIQGKDATQAGGTISERVVVQSINSEIGAAILSDCANTYKLDPQIVPSLTSIRVLAVGSTKVNAINGKQVTVADAQLFRVGDMVTKDDVVSVRIERIDANVLFLHESLPGLNNGDSLKIANVTPAHTTFRVKDTTGLYPGSLVSINSLDANNNPVVPPDYAVIEHVDSAGFVTLRAKPERKKTHRLPAKDTDAPYLIPHETRLVITTTDGKLHRINNLSIDPYHPRYIFNKTILDEISSQCDNQVRVQKPDRPPIKDFPGRLINTASAQGLTGGKDDEPNAISSTEYQAGLKVLENIDDVNLVCVPDAASHPAERQSIQQAMIEHCLQLQDRFAILDSIPGASLSGTGSIDEQRKALQSDRGFAALYYPWLEVRDPASNGPSPRTMFIPPCGHIAGVYARTDAEIGVHKAPANADVRGVLGLERRLSDGQHGPLNLAGINALRIFPSSAQVIIWGARTTVDPNITDWLYVNVRRLMLYIEESIDEGIRWAVFKPNNLALWQQLKRTINDFLTRVWRSGALFGDKPEQAFYVRIDEALNPESTRALGRLYIEIGVAPVRPAEFIIVRIGLWDGGASITEA